MQTECADRRSTPGAQGSRRHWPPRRYWLRDGSAVTIRPAGWSDEPALARMLAAASPLARHQRFFAPTNPARAARSLVAVEAEDLALVAESDTGAIVAHGAWYRLNHGKAEVAFIVRDDWQSRGAASLLLSHLAETAAAAGIRQLVASVLAGNAGMLAVFEQSGMPVTVRYEPGALRVSLLTVTDEQPLARAALAAAA